MFLITVQCLIIFVLVSMLICIYLDEFRESKRRAAHAIIEELWFGKERRKTVRTDTNLDVVYSSSVAKGKKTRTRDISTGGAKIQIEEKLRKGTPLLLEIVLPDIPNPIAANAEVAWVSDTPIELPSGKRAFEIGVKFINLKPADEDKISAYIKKTFSS